MKNSVTKDYVNWQAVENARDYWHKVVSPLAASAPSYYEWMLDEGGIEHGPDYIRVVDEQRYLLFVLKWA